MPSLFLALVLACSQPSPQPAQPQPAQPQARLADSVQIAAPYARAMPAGSPTSAAFMRLRNDGDGDTALVGARSTASRTVELHTHTEVDGMMQMRQVPRIELPAGQEVLLQPGGLHVMFIGLERELAAGSEVDLVLVFEDGSESALTLPVREVMPAGGAAHGSDG